MNVEGKKLSYRFPGQNQSVIRDLSFDFPSGSRIAVMGPSGVGKSTLLRLIGGLLKPSAGTINGSASSIFVFQDPRLLPWRSALRNVSFGLEASRLRWAEIRSRSLAALSEVGLSDLAGRYPYQLSGGQQQRVGIARALVRRPELLLLDEPFSALQEGLREELHALIKDLQRRNSMTVISVTHDYNEAMRHADRVYVLENDESGSSVLREISPVLVQQVA